MAAPTSPLADAFRLLQAGRAQEALAAAARIARKDPENARVHLVTGIALRMLGRMDEARVALEHATALDPKDAGAAFELGVLHAQRGDSRGALVQFERAAELKPGFVPAHFSAGLQRFNARDWAGAAASFEKVMALEPANVEALTNLGQALAEQGRGDEARATLDRALALQPRNAAARHALGWVLHKAGRAQDAIAHYREAAALDARNVEWHMDAARAHAELRQWDAAREAYERALALEPRHVPGLRAAGQLAAARGDFARAARLFSAAAMHASADEELPMFAAQSHLLLGHWREGWAGYARREHRRRFEAQQAARGTAYRLPALAELAGREATLVGEQGLGDVLFFLRFAPALAAAGARLSFAGEPRLHPLLARTGLFAALRTDFAPDDLSSLPLLTADLPLVAASSIDPYPPSLRIAPLPERLAAWRATLAAFGPPPWIGVTWRAGTPRDVLAQGLYKTIAIEDLFAALAPLEGTVVALQRAPSPDELATAGRALGRTVHDASRMNDDLEDALALVATLDRHIGVSNTNMHLAAAAGASADVLVPFPPEWRWGTQGDSAWFPGFRVHRQDRDGNWPIRGSDSPIQKTNWGV